MDLIRIYTEITFSRVANRFLSRKSPLENLSAAEFPLSENFFLDEARTHYPELSDDNLRMIYLLGIDEWSRFGFEGTCKDEGNIFQSLAYLASQLLTDSSPYPLVHFKDLFRWREITQLLGEDLLTCAWLAFTDRNTIDVKRKFDWPSVIHNDNPHLNYLFSEMGLCELHSHLKASTNTFEISWVCLMNHINGQAKNFDKLEEIHEPSLKGELGKKIYEFVIEASHLRLSIYKFLSDGDRDKLVSQSKFNTDTISIDSETNLERQLKSDQWIPDYIFGDQYSPMSVYTGERRLLYFVFKRIFADNSQDLTALFYRYILCKSMLRSYFIQINKNIGFSNFQRYQTLKSKFLKKEYSKLLESLPLWESSKHNFTKIFETRITPVKNRKKLFSILKNVEGFTNEDSLSISGLGDVDYRSDWCLIFHFIKNKYKCDISEVRNRELRNKNKKESGKISGYISHDRITGIDAASSEFDARPEEFGQPFRFLHHFGFDATFHAGEDFYDIADGLRAIDEAIRFLQLRPSDRIGHALALGVNAENYYNTRHKTIALPKQYMLDNVVWLLMMSKKHGISMDVKTEWFLKDNYRILVNEIGYAKANSSDNTNGSVNFNDIPDISDYWESMMLRGDNPESYNSDGTLKNTATLSSDTWDYYAFVDSDDVRHIRHYNVNAKRLYYYYHYGNTIMENGDKVKSFQLPDGYSNLITELQNAMMKQISKSHICIECCPSSNVRIGRLARFDSHPIFRFMPVNPWDTRYPLAVTVNTDDLGVFSTSLPNEYSLLALALLKMKDKEGNHIYSTQEVYDWIRRVIENGHKFTFLRDKGLAQIGDIC